MQSGGNSKCSHCYPTEHGDLDPTKWSPGLCHVARTSILYAERHSEHTELRDILPLHEGICLCCGVYFRCYSYGKIIILLPWRFLVLECTGCLSDIASDDKTRGYVILGQLFVNSCKWLPLTKILQASIIVIVQIFAMVSVVATASRMLWAFVREGGLPCSKYIARVILFKSRDLAHKFYS